MPKNDTMNSSYWSRVVAYRTSMTIAKELPEKGIITKEDYNVISKMLSEKYE